MLELAMIVCASFSPHHCKDVSLIFADVSPVQCQMGFGAQVQIAKWIEGHPNWRVASWKCQIAGKFARL